MDPDLNAGGETCDFPGCKEVGRFRCGSCKVVLYCSKEHQKESWKANHKSICTAWQESQVGYPKESILDMYSLPRSTFIPITAEEFVTLEHRNHILFTKIRAKDPKGSEVGMRLSIVSSKQAWLEQFSALTRGLFEDWDASLWENVIIAGGSVLASTLPPDSRFRRLKQGYCDPTNMDFNFSSSSQGRILKPEEPDKSLSEYFQQVRWPNGDIDIFFYGLKSEKEGSEKLKTVLAALRRKIKMTSGMEQDVLFTITTNTVTLVSPPHRKLQVITRIYASKSDVLNSFDIDCCCVGYDGTSVLLTPRCVESIRNKANTVSLDIRGDAYENRLLKYAERGFSIAVPKLRGILSELDGKYIKIEVEDCQYWGVNMDGSGWARWASSENLERLLMAEHLSDKMQIIYKPFRGRMRSVKHIDPEAAECIKYKVLVNPSVAAADSYPASDPYNKQAIFPATTQLSSLGLGMNESPCSTKFSVSWRFGNMPRKPLSFEEWSRSAMGKAKKAQPSYDFAKMAEERRVEAAAEALEKERVAKAERDAEHRAILKDAEERATKKVETKMSALAQAAEKEKGKAREAMEQAEIARKQAVDAETETAAAKVQVLAAQAAAEAAAQGQGCDAGEQMCVVCWSRPKCIMLEPCRHVCLCETCFSFIKNAECPLCRSRYHRGTKLFL